MDISDYTSYDAIRSVLGVSDDELEDATLALPLYSNGLEDDLYSVSATLLSTYATIGAKTVGTRTDKESSVYRLTQLFATYSVAKQLCTSLPMFGPKSVTDGKAAMSRFSGTPYQDTAQGISEKYDLYLSRLTDALAALSSSVSTVTTPIYMLAATPDYDPVVGDGT